VVGTKAGQQDPGDDDPTLVDGRAGTPKRLRMQAITADLALGRKRDRLAVTVETVTPWWYEVIEHDAGRHFAPRRRR
jgi:hypothetical protein